ncbi:hypothetical protein BD289DRAFT_486140 [Coniella lustricola]|uniref:Uncharacterized protein n=1 Tax=Coniella lustricola TaxID=2025994 RepID=A0A2T2ZW46_9PEZI|nr:hypothetical protein BD289DRAFT_486140 [Coniella lustricola]
MFGFQPIHNHLALSSGPLPPFTMRRRSTTSSETSEVSRISFASNMSAASAASTINSVLFRQPSVIDLQQEHEQFSSKLTVLEPRPIVFYGSMEERFSSF